MKFRPIPKVVEGVLLETAQMRHIAILDIDISVPAGIWVLKDGKGVESYIHAEELLGAYEPVDMEAKNYLFDLSAQEAIAKEFPHHA